MIFLLKNQVSSSVTLITWLPRNHYLSLDFFSSVLAFFLAFSLAKQENSQSGNGRDRKTESDDYARGRQPRRCQVVIIA